MIKFTIHALPPSLNSAYRHSSRNRIIYMTKEGKDFIEFARIEARSQYQGEPLKGRLRVVYEIFFPDNRRTDIANREKLLSDALEGSIFVNDSQIDEMVIKRNLDKKTPRVEINVDEIRKSYLLQGGENKIILNKKDIK